MTHTLDRYEERLLGLPYPVVLLNAAEEITDPDTGEVLGVAVPHAEELAAAVALALCFQPFRLTGAEVRFIRRVLGMTGQELATAVEMDPATLSRWEHGKQPVGEWADKALRMAAVLRLQDRAPGFSHNPSDVVSIHPAARPDGLELAVEVRRIRPLASEIESDAAGWDALARAALIRDWVSVLQEQAAAQASRTPRRSGLQRDETDRRKSGLPGLPAGAEPGREQHQDAGLDEGNAGAQGGGKGEAGRSG